MAETILPRALVLAFSDLGRDPRVDRQIRCLSAAFRVIAAGWAEPDAPAAEFVRLAPRPKSPLGQMLGAARLVAARYESYYWSTRAVTDCLRRLADRHADLVLANDIDALPVALRLAGQRPVLFDAHEYAPREFEDRATFRLLYRRYRSYLCRRYIPRVRAMTTVGPRIAEEYERDTGVRPEVVWNAPDFADLRPTENEAATIRLVHHGGAQRSRQLERMIRMMAHVDARFELDLVLVGHDRGYLRFLRRTAGGDRRIRFVDPVPMRTLPAFLNRYDVGVFLLPPVNFNYRYALPNKLFEFVQARLAVAIGPSPEMARLVREHGLGVVAEDFEPASLAACLARLSAERLRELKGNVHRAAPRLCGEAGRRRWLELAQAAVAERS